MPYKIEERKKEEKKAAAITWIKVLTHKYTPETLNTG